MSNNFLKSEKTFLQNSCNNDNVSAVVLDKDDVIIRHAYKEPCHGFLQVGATRKVSDCSKLLTRVKHRNWVKKADALAFIDFWVNRSNVADVFLRKDPEETYEKGFVSHFDVQGNKLGYALLGSRFCFEAYTVEVSQRLPMFTYFLKQGFSEQQAFVLSQLYNITSDYKNFSFLQTGHSVFNTNVFTKSVLSNSLKGSFANLDKQTYLETGYYSRNPYTVNSVYSKYVEDGFYDELKNYSVSSVKKLSFNIFEEAKKQASNFVTKDEKVFLDTVTTLVKEYA